MLMNYVAIFWGSSRGDLISKLVFCCCKHVIIFQGMKAWVTMQLNKKHAPFVIGIHCMAHTCNLAMQSFLNISLVAKIKAMYIYSPRIYIFLTLLDEEHWACKVDKKIWNKVGRSFIMLRLENLDACTYQTCFAIL